MAKAYLDLLLCVLARLVEGGPEGLLRGRCCINKGEVFIPVLIVCRRGLADGEFGRIGGGEGEVLGEWGYRPTFRRGPDGRDRPKGGRVRHCCNARLAQRHVVGHGGSGSKWCVLSAGAGVGTVDRRSAGKGWEGGRGRGGG